MALPVVAIVGRPNVGKSSLFNAIAGRRMSIVEPSAGVTRDRVTTICELDDQYFELVDTGGHGIVDRDDLGDHVERQIRYAIEQAHLILFVVDVREGITPLDRDTAELLRPKADRVRVLANKADEPRMEGLAGEFIRLGFGEPLAVSAVSGEGRTALREMIRDAVRGVADEVPSDPVMNIAIVGKRNAGKSTFVNAMVGEDRVIVSEVPGTTRDSIDVRFEKDGRTLVVIDTAGIRKKSKIATDIEFYAYSRATASIGRADVVILLIDATVPVGQVDKKLARLIVDEHKPCILVVNKWDLAKGRASTDEYGDYLAKVMPEVAYAPVAFTSAVTGRNIASTIDLATELLKQSRIRVGTGQLNQALKGALARGNVPRPKRGQKAPKFFYATQVSTCPPTIVVFVNGPELVTTSFERFLLNRFHEALPFTEIPIRLVFRARRERWAVRER
jgi:GTP-binding protein